MKASPLRLLHLVVAVACAAAPALAAAQASSFDGAWHVTLTCPPHNAEDDAKGYTHRFAGQVVDGQMRAVHGKEGEPGWHLVTGRIAADGSATLQVDGIVNNEKYAINNAQRGKAYKYKVKAQFEAKSGSGERLTGRVCHFSFAR
ncbi:MAG: hypothetical protein K8R60_07885 [Burkholderiales bacterium]|nr:hypothetical protein [Burkholderiales bacterium]